MRLSKYVVNPFKYNLNLLESSYTKETVGLGPLSREFLCKIVSIASQNKLYSAEDIVLRIIAEELVCRGLIVPEAFLGSEESYLDCLLSTRLPDYGFFGLPTCRSNLIPSETLGFVFGAPFDGGSPRPGSCLAAKTLRETSQSFCFRGNNPDSIFSIRKGASPFKNASVVDIGDVHVKNHNTNDVHNRIVKLINNSPIGSIPIMIGGDHSLTLSSIRGLISKDPTLKEISFIQFDSHCDMKLSGIYDKSNWVDLHDVCHANFVSKLLYDFSDLSVFQIGVDDFQSLGAGQVAAFSEISQRVTMISDLMIMCEGVHQLVSKLPRDRKVYISVDVDVFSRNFVSNTGYPSRCGIDPGVFFKFLNYIFENNQIVGMDLMEFSPSSNSGHESKFVAYILLQMISLLSSHKETK